MTGFNYSGVQLILDLVTPNDEEVCPIQIKHKACFNQV